MLEGRDGRSHRGDPPDFPTSAARVAGSVDVQHGVTAEAALQESVKRSGRLAPRGFELDLAVESPAGHQRAEEGRSPAPLAWEASSSGRFSV